MNCFDINQEINSDNKLRSHRGDLQDAFTEKIIAAKSDYTMMETIIQEYTPFIRKQLTKELTTYLEYEDCLSIAMLTFVNCIRQYEVNKGTFIAYAAKAIRNRLIDENKKETNYRYHIETPSETEKDSNGDSLEHVTSLSAYQKELERESLADEINALDDDLKKFDITINELSKVAPKQKRARVQCLELALQLKATKKLWNALWDTRRLPQADLARIASVSVKTIEKHRKYIITLCIILQGQYPAVKAFFLDGTLAEPSEHTHSFHLWKKRKEVSE